MPKLLDANLLPHQNPVYLEYLASGNRIRDLFGFQPWVLDEAGRISSEIRGRKYPRRELREILLAQNREFGTSSAAMKRIDLITEENTFVVATGQQPGLFGGPLYNLYKAITAIKLAEILEQRFGNSNFIPLFYIGADDHDFDEVSSYTLLNRGFEIVTITYRPDEDSQESFYRRTAVGAIEFTAQIEQSISEFEKELPDTEFKKDVTAMLKRDYCKGVRFDISFGRLLASLLGDRGLVLFTPRDSQYKRLARSVFEREAVENSRSTEIFFEAARRIEELGFPVTVKRLPDRLNIFYEDPSRRPVARLDMDDDAEGHLHKASESQSSEQSGIRSTREESLLHLSAEELKRALEEHPERFSGNVLIRPILFSFLFPNPLYVLGPNELGYWPAISTLYEHFGVPAPYLWPRGAATIVESRIARAIENLAVEVHSLVQEEEKVFNEVAARRFPSRIEDSLVGLDESLTASLEWLIPEISEFDPTLVPVFEKFKSRSRSEIKELKSKVLRSIKRRESELASQLKKARNSLFPNGMLQERRFGILQYLVKYGERIMDHIFTELDPEARGHQLIEGFSYDQEERGKPS